MLRRDLRVRSGSVRDKLELFGRYMMKEAHLIKEIPLASTEDGAITVATVKEPYGQNSSPIVSLGIWLSKTSEEPDWKVHIPVENLDDVIEALKEAKKAL